MAEMTEPEPLALPPGADPFDQPPSPPPERALEPRATVALVVAILSLLGLAAGSFWVARTGGVLERRLAQVEQAQRAQPAADPAKLSQLDEQVTALRGDVTKLQAAPAQSPVAAPSAPTAQTEPAAGSTSSPQSTQAGQSTPSTQPTQSAESPPPSQSTATAPATLPASSPQPASAVDLKSVEDRIAALEQRPAAPPVDTALQDKMQALLGQLSGLTQQVQGAQAAAKTAQDAATAAQQQAKASQEQSSTSQDQAKAAQDQAKAAEERAKTAEDHAKTAEEQAKTAQDQAKSAQGQASSAQGEASSAQAQTSAAADRAGQAQQLQVAAAALEAGRPLGEVPGAPQALTRFASTPPPTEASLRLSYPAAARQAAEASRPSLKGESLVRRMWTRAQSLVTVKQGGRVLVGAPAAATLAEAQQRLDAGDLTGSLHALQALDPAAAAAMASWRDQAQALVDARTSLAASVAAMAHR